MLLNIALYAFAAIGAFTTLMCVMEYIQERIGTGSASSGIPKPHTPKVQLGVLTPSLMEKLYKLEYAALPIECRKDLKAQLPENAYSYPNYMSGHTCNYLLDAIDYIRNKRGVYPLKIASNMDDILRLAISQHEKSTETGGNE